VPVGNGELLAVRNADRRSARAWLAGNRSIRLREAAGQRPALPHSVPSPDNPAVSTEPDTLAAVETDTAPCSCCTWMSAWPWSTPAGLMVHDSKLARGEDDFLADRLREQLGRPIFLVHRLDRATSGCLLLAFDRETASALGKALMGGEVPRTT
jgi:tRNA pseudouridine65 synthase